MKYLVKCTVKCSKLTVHTYLTVQLPTKGLHPSDSLIEISATEFSSLSENPKMLATF